MSLQWSSLQPFVGLRHDTEGTTHHRQCQSLPFLLFWWKLLDFPRLWVALEDLTGKVQVVGYCFNSNISSDLPVKIQ